MASENKKMTVKDFLDGRESPEIEDLIGRFNSGSFMECHTAIFAQTGIWIDELVPVFQKLDATLAVAQERQVRRLSPDLVRS